MSQDLVCCGAPFIDIRNFPTQVPQCLRVGSPVTKPRSQRPLGCSRFKGYDQKIFKKKKIPLHLTRYLSLISLRFFIFTP